MKKLYSFAAMCCLVFSVHAQTFWTESFSTGCNRGTVASSYTGTNGAWAITSTGTNDAQANQWFVSATCNNTGVNNCSNSCNTAAVTNGTLHLSNISLSIVGIAADTGASYFTGGLQSFGIHCNTSRQAESPVINCTGKSNITLSFIYLQNAQPGTDYATLMYYDGTTWSALTPALVATPPGSCSTFGQWTAYSCTLPASANNNANVKIGFNWVNNDDGVGNDPSFAVDDIMLSTAPTGVNNLESTPLQVFANGKNIHVKSSDIVKLAGVMDLLGRDIPCGMQNNIISLEGQETGIYFIRLIVNGELVTRKIYIQ